MPTFDILYKEFAKTKNGNLCNFFEKYKKNSIGTRFLLIRTFDSSNIVQILNLHKIKYNTNEELSLMKILYNSNIEISDLLDYIESNRNKLIRERIGELEGLQKLIQKLPIVECGIRDDNIDALVKEFTRNKNLKDIDAVNNFLSSHVIPRFKQYCLWSFYNQTTNDIIELYLLQHPKIIPTPRKIINIDFFLKIGDDIVPFDQKITNISDNYFELASQGLIEVNNGTDSFVIGEGPKEFQRMKEYYKQYKKYHKEKNLPNISALPKKKSEFADYIASLDVASKEFIDTVKKDHSSFVSNTSDNLKRIEWWNFKNQASRLFCNNNRFFIFVAYKSLFSNAKELKTKIDEISKQITSILDNLTEESFHTINYQYTSKEIPKLNGNYTALALSILYTE